MKVDEPPPFFYLCPIKKRGAMGGIRGKTKRAPPYMFFYKREKTIYKK